MRSPIRLAPYLPPIRRILSGRSYVLAMDESGYLWTWANWGRAGLITGDWLTHTDIKVKDMAAGWHFSAVLIVNKKTSVQEVWVWYQRFLPSEEDTVSALTEIPGRENCYEFEPQCVRLPDLTAVSAFENPAAEDRDPSEHIEKLAAGDNFLVALSNSGKVYRIAVLPLQRGPRQRNDEEDQQDEVHHNDGRLRPRQMAEIENLIASRRLVWDFLPYFSHPEKRLYHISANFETFFAIGDGVVLQGRNDMTNQAEPVIRPELQNRGVIR